MFAHRRAALPVLVSLALVGCARMPATQPMSRDVAAAMQPVDVKVGIKQPELYADFERSMAGAGAAAACGAVPGLGVLLAAACGGAMGAMDATVNSSRAKVADDTVRPLKDEIVDLKFDQLMSESLTQSLKSVPGMQLSGVAVTKTVDGKSYEETFRASTASAVMFVNIDYHITKDFSTLEVSARSLVYPRGAAARAAAGLPAALPTEPKDLVLALKNTAYRVNVFYHAKLPLQSTAADYVAAWKADGARLLRTGLQEGTARLGRLLADDLQRVPGAERASLAKVDAENGVKADLISNSPDGRLLRYPDGSLHFSTTARASATADASPKATTAAAGAKAVQ